jgi:arginyl-tRNA synthetase
MIAWQKHANGATPEITGKKGDHLVGDYYVKFEEDLKAQAVTVLAQLQDRKLEGFTKEEEIKIMALLNALEQVNPGQNKEKYNEIKSELNEIARNNTPIMKEAKQMLLKWEQGDEKILSLWRKMNNWVYAGFDETYKRIGSNFDKIYYESDLYLLGKDIVEEGLQKGVLFRKDDGSVWIDLTADGLDEKLVLRRDGTSVYITQDLGLAQLKYKEYGIDESIYVVGDEQNYHLKVLKLIMQKLGAPYANGITHLSYGMVELPTGKMKSREGTVVDADDLVDAMIEIAKQKTKEQGKTEGFTDSELRELYETIGMGALKFFLLRVDPKKRMIFNPEESIELQGFTGPFVQYTHARIKSILRKEQPKALPLSTDLLRLEKDIIIILEQFQGVIEESGNDHDPSKIAIYAFNLAKTFNSFYTEHSIANAETEEKKELRLQLAVLTARTIKTAMGLLGIAVPERM